ncbi:L,D-transpeptidase Cds6 family protein [Chitinimonas sp. JJ19]|uniref:L,D-transpeptidase Cds6 family protein n=1 Tax=Chitinimonas sp. JJ19 TaxID=3109352 RepID=UPI00300117C3
MPAYRLPSLLLSLALISGAYAGEAEDIATSLNRGQADAALQAADKALAKTPRDARLRLLRGNALAQLGRSGEAIQVFTALTGDYPNLPEPYNNLAALYAQQGQLDKARAALQMALQTNPAYATAHANLADVYARLAAQAYDKALQRDIVERQNGSAAPVIKSDAPRLALVQDLLSRPAPGGTPAPVVAAARPPVVVAAAKPATPPVTLPPVAAASKPVTPTTPAVLAPVPTKPAEVKPAPTKPVEPKPAEPKVDDSANEEQVVKAVRGWADAWSDKRVPAYLASYSRSFKPGGMSRSEWEKQRRERIDAARKIEVKLANIRVKFSDGGQTATVRLVQRYKSDKLDTSTGKTLILERNGSRWLIREERVG